MPWNRPWTASTFCLVGASTQSSRRSTVSGRITSWYLPRLKVSRMRSATPQMKLAIWLWFMFSDHDASECLASSTSLGYRACTGPSLRTQPSLFVSR